MKPNPALLIIIVIAVSVILICPALALSSDGQKVLYQNTFSTDPHWTTNNPSSDYWDPSVAMYHFAIEPSTGNYAWAPVDYTGGSFTLEYDVIFDKVDDGATFRLGFSDKDMDRMKGPNIVTEFTTTKYGKIMRLHLVTQNAKLNDVTSESASYGGSTVNYVTNTTYHVTVIYDDDKQTLTERVTEKTTGKQVWSYYVNTGEQLSGMTRLYIGSVGDYGTMYKYATGYIDNVRLFTPMPVTETPTIAISASLTPTSQYYTTHPTTRKPTTVATTVTTPTQKSPLSPICAGAALGILGTVAVMTARPKKK